MLASLPKITVFFFSRLIFFTGSVSGSSNAGVQGFILGPPFFSLCVSVKMTQPILVDPGTISVQPTPKSLFLHGSFPGSRSLYLIIEHIFPSRSPSVYVSNSLFLPCPKPLPHLCCPSRQSSSRDWGVIRDFPTGLHLSPPRSRNRMSYYFIYSQF